MKNIPYFIMFAKCLFIILNLNIIKLFLTNGVHVTQYNEIFICVIKCATKILITEEKRSD